MDKDKIFKMLVEQQKDLQKTMGNPQSGAPQLRDQLQSNNNMHQSFIPFHQQAQTPAQYSSFANTGLHNPPLTSMQLQQTQLAQQYINHQSQQYNLPNQQYSTPQHLMNPSLMYTDPQNNPQNIRNPNNPRANMQHQRQLLANRSVGQFVQNGQNQMAAPPLTRSPYSTPPQLAAPTLPFTTIPNAGTFQQQLHVTNPLVAPSPMAFANQMSNQGNNNSWGVNPTYNAHQHQLALQQQMQIQHQQNLLNSQQQTFQNSQQLNSQQTRGSIIYSKLPQWAKTRIMWETGFLSFRQKHNIITQIPLVANEKIDMFFLFSVVLQCGGYDQVCKFDGWSNIAKAMQNESPQAPAFFQRLYSHFILAFEYATIGANLRTEINGVEAAINSTNSSVDEFKYVKSSTPIPPDSLLASIPDPSVENSQISIDEEQNIIDEKDYVPKTRYIYTHGGINFDRILDDLPLDIPTKESYDSCDFMRLMLRLESGLDFEIKYALDLLVIYSAEGNLNFKKAPYLLDSLANIMKSCLQKTITSEAPGKFIPYSELLQIETDMIEKMGKKNDTRELSIGLIIRNSSFSADNQQICSSHADLRQLLYSTLSISYPSRIMNQFKSGSYFIDQFHSLEHRKNSLITLSNISNTLILEPELAALIILVCEDMMHSPYEYSVLDLLSKLLLNENNHRLLADIGMKGLAEIITEALPSSWPLEPTVDQMASWELMLVILITIIQNTGCTNTKKMLSLCRKPIVSNPALFDNLRERCSVIISGANVSEDDLLNMINNSMKLGDPFMAMAMSRILADIALQNKSKF